MLLRVRPRIVAALIFVIVASFGTQPARAGGSPSGSDLSTAVEASGSGTVVNDVQTPQLRARVPDDPGARILLIGTGVARALFPASVQPAVVAHSSAADLLDTHGYGTLAASTLLQMLPNATIVSRRVPAYDASWTLLNMTELASALDDARAHAADYDAVLLAFPPNAALDPVSDLIGHADYGVYGKGMAMVDEAMLATPQAVRGIVAGIPADRALRDKVFARADLLHRAAVEKYAASALAWRTIIGDVAALSNAGVAVVAPAGDFTRKDATGNIVPLPTQTVYGLSALPSVITVGASYEDAGVPRVSPTSGRGPTLGLAVKPDLLAPSDVMAMLPATSALSWPDDSMRAPLQTLNWARAGTTPTPCPSLTNAYRCVLQGSSMVSASVVAANIATLVAAGTPHLAGARAATDDEVLRGLAWAAASGVTAQAYGDARDAYGWEQGAGVMLGMRGLDPRSVPVALARASFGEVSPNKSATASIPLWSGGATPSVAKATIAEMLGADPSGAAAAAPWKDAARVTSSVSGAAVALTAAAGKFQGGVYTGAVALTTPSGARVDVPLDLVQDVAVDFHVNAAFTDLMTGGPEGERVEDASMVLFAGMPSGVGLVGAGFKNLGGPGFAKVGGDPTNAVVIRAATTRNSFTDPSVPAAEHGRARIAAVPPGFYRFHVLTDASMEATQSRGRDESLGIGLASFGPDALNAPGENIFIPSCVGSESGPMACTPRANVDPTNGLCTVRAPQATFNVYCGEIAYALPAAVVSRAVHLVSFDTSPARSEWGSCNVDVPLDGTTLDLGAIVQKARACGGVPAPTAWNLSAGAPDCLGPTERAATPRGNPTDVTAAYQGTGSTGLPGRNLPVQVLNYDFPLPDPNTYTTATLELSYAARNAIVAVRFSTGDSAAADASNSLLVIDDPAVAVTPAVRGAGTRGAATDEWTVMSSNAREGHLSIVVIPTAWSSSSLNPTIASVQLCDVGLRVATFAKTHWSVPQASVQRASIDDRGLTDNIDPSRSRVRATYDSAAGAFADAGTEREGLVFGVQIPKNSTASSSVARHVRSPRGGPAYFRAARGTSTGTPAAFAAADPGRGTTSLACDEGPASFGTAPPSARAMWTLCRQWNAARASSSLLAELGPDLAVNGRFGGAAALSEGEIFRAGGKLTYEVTDGDDGGAFNSKWSGARFSVGDFYDETGTPMQLSALNGVLQVSRDRAGNPVLNVRAGTPADGTYTLSATLR
jgi:hypothetical protein